MENKFRAVRYGLDGKMIDFGKQIEVPARELIAEYLAFVDDTLDELGSQERDWLHPDDAGAGFRGGSAVEGLPRNGKPAIGGGLHGFGDEGRVMGLHRNFIMFIRCF